MEEPDRLCYKIQYVDDKDQDRNFRHINESIASKKGENKTSKKQRKHNLQIIDLNALKDGGTVNH